MSDCSVFSPDFERFLRNLNPKTDAAAAATQNTRVNLVATFMMGLNCLRGVRLLLLMWCVEAACSAAYGVWEE